jgi:hypothetical protein
MGRIASLSNQLQQVLDYGNPVLDAPEFDPSVFPEAAPSAPLDMMGDMMGGGMGMEMGGTSMGGDSMGDPMEDPGMRGDLMNLLSQRATQRKSNTDQFTASAMAANKK